MKESPGNWNKWYGLMIGTLIAIIIALLLLSKGFN